MHRWFWRFLAIYLFWNMTIGISTEYSYEMQRRLPNFFGLRTKRDFSDEPKKPFIIPSSSQQQLQWLRVGSEGQLGNWLRVKKLANDPRLSPGDLPDVFIDYPNYPLENDQSNIPVNYDSRAEPMNIERLSPRDMWAPYDKLRSRTMDNSRLEFSGLENNRYPQFLAKGAKSQLDYRSPEIFIRQLTENSESPYTTISTQDDEESLVWPIFESKPPRIRIGDTDISINSPALHRFLRKYYYFLIKSVKNIKEETQREKSFKVMHVEFAYIIPEVLKHRKVDPNDTAMARSNKYLRRMEEVVTRNQMRGLDNVVVPTMSGNPAGNCSTRVPMTKIAISPSKEIKVNSSPLNMVDDAVWSKYDCPLYFENAEMHVIPYDDDDGVDISPPKVVSVGESDIHVLIRGPHLYNGEELLGDNHLLYFYKCMNVKIDSVKTRDERECYFIDFHNGFLQFLEPYLQKEKILEPINKEETKNLIKNASTPTHHVTSANSLSDLLGPQVNVPQEKVMNRTAFHPSQLKERRQVKELFRNSRQQMTRQEEMKAHKAIVGKFENMISDAASASGYRTYGFLAFLSMTRQKLIALFILILILFLMTFFSAFYMCRIGRDARVLRARHRKYRDPACRPCTPCSSDPCTSNTSYEYYDSSSSPCSQE